MTALFFQHEEKNLVEFIKNSSYSSISILCDSKTNGFCISVFEALFPQFRSANLIVIPEGEEHKNWEICELIFNEFAKLNLDKNALLINLGGGVITDLGGFCASIYKRGIAFIHCPTTVLAQCDAAIGGKNGINFHHSKNQLGTINEAKAIYFNPIFFQTLPERQIKNGVVEMIKHELLFNKNALQYISAITNLTDLLSTEVIKKHVAYKNNLVEKDQNDANERQQLNFGHSLGHAIESHSLTTKNKFFHGEAILLGMIYELQLSKNKGFKVQEIYEVLLAFKENFFKELHYTFDLENLLPFLLQDKKNTNEIKMSLLEAVADCKIKSSVSMAELQKLNAI